MRVRDLQGRRWSVRRRWLPWRRRLRDVGGPDVPDVGGVDDPISAVLVVVLLVIALPFVVALVVLLAEVLLLLLLLPLFVLLRVVLRRPWVIEVIDPSGSYTAEPMVGWRASRRRIDELADEVRSGKRT